MAHASAGSRAGRGLPGGPGWEGSGPGAGQQSQPGEDRSCLVLTPDGPCLSSLGEEGKWQNLGLAAPPWEPFQKPGPALSPLPQREPRRARGSKQSSAHPQKNPTQRVDTILYIPGQGGEQRGSPPPHPLQPQHPKTRVRVPEGFTTSLLSSAQVGATRAPISQNRPCLETPIIRYRQAVAPPPQPGATPPASSSAGLKGSGGRGRAGTPGEHSHEGIGARLAQNSRTTGWGPCRQGGGG